ncbi:hydroxybutyrate dehydrogenase [Danaus plexippus plexippus]|uniref:Hydroxybutyrate dehydrogenase n=1 Tax=Danaus plexippus plexippus TaxID=278856 RepID=A0A212ETR6_DANPL|nr:hydroxybutyrate dehydrogenase [Danaus plexippus plexippus]
MPFINKVVLVVGGSSGIGAATAIKLCGEGARVAIVGRNKSKLKAVENQCEGILVINADVRHDEDIKKIVDTTVNHFGKLDVLINSVGVACFASITAENAMEEFDKTMAVNLRAAVYLSHLAIPHLIKTKGNIVNISSVASTAVFFENHFAYCTSKAGLDHFTRSIALELAPKGVRINIIIPGPVKTDYINGLISDIKEHEKFYKMLENRTALGKQSEANEIADLILYIASEKARSITGSSFVIDNGMLLKG